MPDLLLEIDRTIVQLGKKSCLGAHFSASEEQQWRGIQRMLDIDHDATVVLGIIIAQKREGRRFFEDDLQEKTAQTQPPVAVRLAVQSLVDKGYLVRGEEDPGEGGLHLSLALEGFLKTRQNHYLEICKTSHQHQLLNKAVGWYKQERGQFLFETMQNHIFRILVDHHEDPLARQLRRLSGQVYEQMALLATAAHSLAQQHSMDLGDLVSDLFPNPVDQLLYAAIWADPKSTLYTQNLLQAAQLIDGRVIRIQLHPKVEGKIIPAAPAALHSDANPPIPLFRNHRPEIDSSHCPTLHQGIRRGTTTTHRVAGRRTSEILFWSTRSGWDGTRSSSDAHWARGLWQNRTGTTVGPTQQTQPTDGAS